MANTTASDDPFQVHMLNETGIKKAEELASGFRTLLAFVETAAGPSAGRELALVRTKLQEASFFAKRAMAMDPENQKRA